MTAALLIAAANVKRFTRNRSFFVIAFVAPFAIMAALSSTIGSALSGEFRPTIAIADELGAGTLDELADGLRQAGFDDLQLVDTGDEARQLVESGEADAAIIFPAALGRSIVDPAAASETIVVVADAEAEISASIAKSIAARSARSFDTVRILNTLGAPTDDISGPIMIESDADVGSRVLTDSTYFAVGMASYFAFFAASGFVATVHRERREATLARMLVSPIDRFAPLLGKGLAAGVVALISFVMLVASSTVLLGAGWGSPVGVAAIGVALSFAAVGVSMAIVSVTKTEESAGQIGAVLATAWAIFGGVFLQLPTTGPLSAASRLSPFRWSLDAVGLNAGAGTTGEVLARAGAIALFGVAGLAIAGARRNELGRI